MRVEEKVAKALLNNIPEVQDRVYPVEMPQDTRKTAVVYGAYNFSELRCLSGKKYHYNGYMQIDVFAQSYAETLKVADAVVVALESEVKVGAVTFIDTMAKHTLRFRRIIDFKIL